MEGAVMPNYKEVRLHLAKGGHSAVAPDCFTTFDHLAISLRM